jgi:hypothetical protein
LANTAFDAAMDQRKQADDLVVLEADNKIARKRIELTTSALQVKGKATLGAYDTYSQALHDESESVTSGMSARQRLDFNRKFQAHDIALKSQLENNTASEMHKFKNDEIDAGITLNQEDLRLSLRTAPAGGTKSVVIGGVLPAEERTKKLVKDWAEHNQITSENIIRIKNEGNISSLHSSAIKELVAMKDSENADLYYRNHKEKLRGDDAISIPKMVEAENTRNTAETIGDEIYATAKADALKSGGVVSESDVNKAADAKGKSLSKEARSHLRDYTAMLMDRDRKALRNEQVDLLVAGSKILRETPPGTPIETAVPANIYAKMNPDTRSAIDGMLVDAGVPQNYYDFKNLGSKIQSMDAITVQNLINKIPSQGGYRADAMKHWETSMSGGKKSEALFTDDKIFSQTLASGLPSARKRPEAQSDAEKALHANLHLEASKAMEKWHNDNPGKSIGQEDQIKLFKNVISGTLVNTYGSFRTSQQRLDSLSPEQAEKAGLPLQRMRANPDLTPYLDGVMERLKKQGPYSKMSADDILQDKNLRKRVERAALYMKTYGRNATAGKRDRILFGDD